jgi:hypothetical protein
MGIEIFKNSGGASLLSGVLQLATGTELNASLKNVTDQLNTNSPLQLSTRKAAISMPDMIETTGTFTGFDITRQITNTAGNSIYRQFNNTYTVNNSGAQTGTITGIFLNATETALNGMTHNLMDFQVGGSSKFLVSRTGTTTITGSLLASSSVSCSEIAFQGLGNIRGISDGVFRLTNNADNNFNRLQFGGTTSSFPSIERSTTFLNFKLADNSNYCQYVGRVGNFTTTNKNAIVTPLAGLLVYDTTLNKLSVYNGSAWETLTSV